MPTTSPRASATVLRSAPARPPVGEPRLPQEGRWGHEGLWRAVPRMGSLVGVSHGRRRASEAPRVSKTEVGGAAISDNNVIQDRNVQELPSLDEALGHGTILAAGGRIARRVVVATQDGGGIGENRTFSRVGQIPPDLVVKYQSIDIVRVVC